MAQRLSKDDLWIGDWLQSSSEKIILGTYHGDEEGEALIKNPAGIIKIGYDKLEVCEPPRTDSEPQEVVALPKYSTKTNGYKFTDAIDLHYDALSRTFHPHHAESILDFQLRICKCFILDAIQKSRNAVHIIHGKGNGILKNHVEELLKEFPEIKWVSTRLDNGSLDVLFH